MMTRTCRPAGGKYLPAADRNVRNTLNPIPTNQNPLGRFTCNAADHVCVQRAHRDLFLFLDGGDIFRGEELLAQKPWLRECQFSRRYADLAIAISRADNKICRERTGERERCRYFYLVCGLEGRRGLEEISEEIVMLRKQSCYRRERTEESPWMKVFFVQSRRLEAVARRGGG